MDSDKKLLHDLYPEIAACGSLRTALEQALANINPALQMGDAGEVFPGAYARVAHAHRSSQVFMAVDERLFISDFWSHGVCLAHGKSAHITETAVALSLWNTDLHSSTRTLKAKFPWVEPSAWAEAHETGNAVEWTWQNMFERKDHSAGTRAAILRASREPALRMLYPFTSMSTLCFSRCTGYPFTNDVPSITPGPEGKYGSSVGDAPPTGWVDLESAIRQVVAHLPPHCGPAWQGTAEDEERRQPEG